VNGHILFCFSLELLLIFLEIVCPSRLIWTGLKNLGGDGSGSNLIVPISNVCATAQRNSDNVLSQYHVLEVMFVAIDRLQSNSRVRKSKTRFNVAQFVTTRHLAPSFFIENRGKLTRGGEIEGR
jgi:hypothetical protein